METKELQSTRIRAAKIYVDRSLGGSRGERRKRFQRKNRVGDPWQKCPRSALLQALFPLLSSNSMQLNGAAIKLCGQGGSRKWCAVCVLDAGKSRGTSWSVVRLLY